MAAPQQDNTKWRGTVYKPDPGKNPSKDMVQARLDSVNDGLREKCPELIEADESGPMSTTEAVMARNNNMPSEKVSTSDTHCCYRNVNH